jgi:hypothetical protein
MKDIKQYLHLYYGCEVSITNLEGRFTRLLDHVFFNTYVDEDDGELYNDPKLLLRPLSDMTEEEALYITVLALNSELDEPIIADEIDFTLNRSDGGLLMDANAAIVLEVTCRCWEGQVAIRNNSDIELWEYEGQHPLSTSNQVEVFRYLLSKGFDLFGLCEAGLAIDRTKHKATV